MALSEHHDRKGIPDTVPIDTLGRRAATGAAVIAGSQIAKVLVQIIGTAILARLLMPEDFGIIAMAGTITGFIGLFTDMGLSTATVQRRQITQSMVSTLFYMNLMIGCGLLLLALAAAPVAAWFFADPRVLPIVIGLALAIPISAAGAQHGALLTRAMRFVPLQLIGIAAQMIALAVAIALARTTEPRYFALVAQVVVGSLVNTILLWIASGWRPSPVFAFRKARSEIAFGAYLAGFSLLNYLHDQFDNLLIGWRFGGTELGYYSRAYNLLTMPLNLVNNSVAQAAVPALSRLADDHARWQTMFLHLLIGCAMGSLGVCTILFSAAEPLIHLMLGPNWTPVILIFQCLVVASIFGSATSPCGYAFISQGKSRPFFLWSLFASPLFAISYVLGLAYGAVGVAVAYSISMAMLAPIYVAYTAFHTGFSFKKSFGPLLLLIAIAGAVCVFEFYLMRELAIKSLILRLTIAIATSSALYFTSCALLLRFHPWYRSLWKLLTPLLVEAACRVISGGRNFLSKRASNGIDR